jgi:hypothetical protein
MDQSRLCLASACARSTGGVVPKMGNPHYVTRAVKQDMIGVLFKVPSQCYHGAFPKADGETRLPLLRSRLSQPSFRRHLADRLQRKTPRRVV